MVPQTDDIDDSILPALPAVAMEDAMEVVEMAVESEAAVVSEVAVFFVVGHSTNYLHY